MTHAKTAVKEEWTFTEPPQLLRRLLVRAIAERQPVSIVWMVGREDNAAVVLPLVIAGDTLTVRLETGAEKWMAIQDILLVDLFEGAEVA